jgi:hypothetical protein
LLATACQQKVYLAKHHLKVNPAFLPRFQSEMLILPAQGSLNLPHSTVEIATKAAEWQATLATCELQKCGDMVDSSQSRWDSVVETVDVKFERATVHQSHN